jgi:hypothetical protein
MQCRECEGRGVVLIDCDHNDKWGVKTCWACITESGKIENECEYCDGYGTVSTCGDCAGDGCDTCDDNGVVPSL